VFSFQAKLTTVPALLWFITTENFIQKIDMIYPVLVLVAFCAAFAQGQKVEGNSTLGICGYSATCSAGGKSGVCVSIGSGCCPGGGVTAGLCPGR